MKAVAELRRRSQRSDVFLAAGREPRRLAELYLDTHGRDAQGRPAIARWCRDWYRWDAGRYRVLDSERVRSEMWSMIDRTEIAIMDPDGKSRRERIQASARLVSDVGDALVSVAPLIEGDAPRWIGAAKSSANLLACPNGILDLEEGELSPPTPDYFVTNVTGASWAPDAPEPIEWFRFLRSVWGSDDELIATLQRMFGYFLSTDSRHQKIFLLVGPKRSGKGTIARICRALLGPEAVANPTLGSLDGEFGLSPLLGAKVAVVGDARLGGRADQAAIAERLLSISGEDALTINRKFRDPISVRLGVRILLISNELPRIADASGALASRFIIIPTARSFIGAEDLGLEDRLMAELPSILRWSVDGWRALRRVGRFEQPAAGRQAVDDLEALSSPIGAFIGDICAVEPGREVEVGDLYARWRTWCEAHGREPGSAQRFGIDLRAVVPGLEITNRRRPDGARIRFYQGVGVA